MKKNINVMMKSTKRGLSKATNFERNILVKSPIQININVGSQGYKKILRELMNRHQLSSEEGKLIKTHIKTTNQLANHTEDLAFLHETIIHKFQSSDLLTPNTQF
jgi:transcriptional regulator CtsR